LRWAIPAASLVAALSVSAEPRYREVDISALGNARLFGINNAGVIALQSVLGGKLESVLFDSHEGEIIRVYPEGDRIAALSDNNNAVGRVRAHESWFDRRGVRLALPLDQALGVNNRGEVAGFTSDVTGPTVPTRAAVYSTSDGTISFMGFGGDFGNATAINSSGQAAGWSTFPGNLVVHAFRWDDGTTEDLGTLGGGSSIGNAIDERGRVAGAARTAAGALHAFLFDDEGMHDLGTLPGCASSEAIALNDAGTVVGTSSSCSAFGGSHVFIFSKGELRDLNDVAPAADGFIYIRVFGINNAGSIIGFALAPDGSKVRPFLLVRGD
jgi:probable HAF family extracellular repeat protein